MLPCAGIVKTLLSKGHKVRNFITLTDPLLNTIARGVSAVVLGALCLTLAATLELHTMAALEFLKTLIWILGLSLVLGLIHTVLDCFVNLTPLNHSDIIPVYLMTMGGGSTLGWALWQAWFWITS